MPNSKLHPRPFRWPNGAIFVGDCYNMRTPPNGTACVFQTIYTHMAVFQ
jgi:hypothetical protein